MLRNTLVAATVALATASAAFAQEAFDFGSIRGLPDRPAVQLDLDPLLLGFATEAARRSDPDAAALLEGIDSVRLRIYKTIENVEDVNEYVNDASQQLERANWRQVVSIDDEGQVRVYVQGDETIVTGVTAMIVGDAEAVFINIAGSLSPDQVAQVVAVAEMDGVFESIGDINGLN